MKNLLELYQKLYKLTEKQKQVIAKGDYDSLLQLLDDKQSFIDEIDKVDVKTYIRQQDSPETFLANLKNIMIKLKKLEDKNAEMMKQKYGDMKAKLKDFNSKQKSREGYQRINKYEAKFIDKKR
ncbi:MAG: flagellar export chaperone FlgN [bacterium]